ncbi:MAG: hypothetical protein ACI38A_01875 [Candidatus Ornithomonoglobus sp.]
MSDNRIHKITSVNTENVVKIVLAVGKGTEECPIHNVIQYWTTDGKFIGERNTLEEPHDYSYSKKENGGFGITVVPV